MPPTFGKATAGARRFFYAIARINTPAKVITLNERLDIMAPSTTDWR
ncbi:MAG: hypothetical protein ACJ8AJ_08460 [Gemmatimonadaceae bacterium]